MGWTYYGGHHYESTFSRFINTYYDPTKFNIDRRKVSLSGPVRMGTITREEALTTLATPPDLQQELVDFCIRKLGYTSSEFDRVMALPPKNYLNYKTSYPVLNRFRGVVRILSEMNVITPVLYEKYLG